MFFFSFLLLSISLQFYLFTEAVCAISATLLKMRLWHRCFHVNFAKFLRTSFSQNSSGRLLLSSPSNLLFITNLSKSLFLLCNISTFYVFFSKKHVQISHVSVKLVITIEKKMNESLTRPTRPLRSTFLQLKGRGENFPIF